MSIFEEQAINAFHNVEGLYLPAGLASIASEQGFIRQQTGFISRRTGVIHQRTGSPARG